MTFTIVGGDPLPPNVHMQEVYGKIETGSATTNWINVMNDATIVDGDGTNLIADPASLNTTRHFLLDTQGSVTAMLRLLYTAVGALAVNAKIQVWGIDENGAIGTLYDSGGNKILTLTSNYTYDVVNPGTTKATEPVEVDCDAYRYILVGIVTPPSVVVTALIQAKLK